MSSPHGAIGKSATARGVGHDQDRASVSATSSYLAYVVLGVTIIVTYSALDIVRTGAPGQSQERPRKFERHNLSFLSTILDLLHMFLRFWGIVNVGKVRGVEFLGNVRPASGGI